MSVQISKFEFLAGRISEFYQNWKQLTSDSFILEMVLGTKIPIEDFDSIQNILTKKNQIKDYETDILDQEIIKLEKLGVIEKSEHEKGEVISPVFLREKSDGSHRMILNLKEFNESVEYQHFKMENLWSAIMLMKKDCYMASVDLKHAYYSVPIHENHRKFLKLKHRGQLYEFTCFPNGLCFCPRYFTKLLKPVYAHLRSQGFLSASFIDDSYLQADTAEECRLNVNATVELFQNLGFVVHDKKSVLEPTKELKYLGFILNSETMTVKLTPEKIAKGKAACNALLIKRRFTIRELSQIIGLIVSFFPGVLWGPLNYHNLEMAKTRALRQSKGEFEALTYLDSESERELIWWINNLDKSYNPIDTSKPDIELKTDAATSGGWGAVCNSTKTGGRWTDSEKEKDINYLEMLAIFFAIKSFVHLLAGKHVKILSDNTTAVAYIKHMGGTRVKEYNDLAYKIWSFCMDKGIWITIAHLSGVLNVEADEKSRKFNDNIEWSLNSELFDRIITFFPKPDIDLFATRLNFKIKPFVSWNPDPESIAVDAFTLDWSLYYSYVFAPFSVIQRCLTKIQRDGAKTLMIVPWWPTAVWWPQMLRLLVDRPLLLPKGKRVLQLTHVKKPHPLHKTLTMLAVRLSGKDSENRDFLQRCVTFSKHRSETQPKNNMTRISKNGNAIVFKEKLIPFQRL